MAFNPSAPDSVKLIRGCSFDLDSKEYYSYITSQLQNLLRKKERKSRRESMGPMGRGQLFAVCPIFLEDTYMLISPRALNVSCTVQILLSQQLLVAAKSALPHLSFKPLNSLAFLVVVTNLPTQSADKKVSRQLQGHPRSKKSSRGPTGHSRPSQTRSLCLLYCISNGCLDSYRAVQLSHSRTPLQVVQAEFAI